LFTERRKKRHGKEEESYDQEVVQEDDQEEEVTRLLPRPGAWIHLLHADVTLGNFKSPFRFGPGSKIRAAKQEESFPATAEAFFFYARSSPPHHAPQR
jgi:hypothetical protein